MLKLAMLFITLANMAAKTYGISSCDDICTVDKLEFYGKVCGSDGKTYETECDLKKEVCKTKTPVSLVHHGMCQYKGQDCLSKITCHMDNAQVCASDGNTYFNECAMRKHACKGKTAKVGVKLGADCSSCPTCSEGRGKQICGSDHKTYKSLCELRAAACNQKQAIIVLKEGACDGAAMGQALSDIDGELIRGQVNDEF